MSSIFCCGNTTSYKNRSLSHEPKFNSFMAWGKVPKTTSPSTDVDISPTDVTFAVQVVRQVNFGPLESKRYFVQPNGGGDEFVEVTEQWLLDANFQKLNTFKNYKCAAHNKFFEINIYKKDPVNTHHWRADIARPAADIDL